MSSDSLNDVIGIAASAEYRSDERIGDYHILQAMADLSLTARDITKIVTGLRIAVPQRSDRRPFAISAEIETRET